MDEAAPEKPRRRPKQARSQAIVEAIFEACERILVAEGPDALNTNRIAEVAGVNIASVYRYFPNKEAIVAEVYEQKLADHAEMLDALDARAAEIDALGLEETLAFVVDALAELHRGLLALDAEFYRKHQSRFDLATRLHERRERRWIEQMQAWLRDVLDRHAPRLRTRDTSRAAFLVAHTVTSAFQAAVREAPEQLEDPAFREDLLAMLFGLLLGPGAPGTQVGDGRTGRPGGGSA
ncbi:MAG: TetR/AcrR family transcriptional regulator [Polyangiales bacterium]